MNNAIYAIPGLMPPTAPNFRSKLVAPENGTLCICVHCGEDGDDVHYAVATSGGKRGVIKDPSYNYGPAPTIVQARILAYQDKMPQFLTISEVLPPHAIVPKLKVKGCPIPLTERPDLERPLYWVLTLPPNALPPGDTVIEVIVNGRLRRYVVQRPRFAIHSCRDITPRFKGYQHQEGEDFDVAIKEGEEKNIVIRMKDVIERPELLEGATYRASCQFGNTTTELQVVADNDVVTITIPAMGPGVGTWKSEFELYGEWINLAAGDLIIVPTQPTTQD